MKKLKIIYDDGTVETDSLSHWEKITGAIVTDAFIFDEPEEQLYDITEYDPNTFRNAFTYRTTESKLIEAIKQSLKSVNSIKIDMI